MRIPVESAATRLAELLELAERGEDVILTRGDKPSVALKVVPASHTEMTAALTPEEKDEIIRDIQRQVKEKPDLYPGVTAARSQDFLYDDAGLPG